MPAVRRLRVNQTAMEGGSRRPGPNTKRIREVPGPDRACSTMGAVEMEALSSPHFAAPFIVGHLLFDSRLNTCSSRDVSSSWLNSNHCASRVCLPSLYSCLNLCATFLRVKSLIVFLIETPHRPSDSGSPANSPSCSRPFLLRCRAKVEQSSFWTAPRDLAAPRCLIPIKSAQRRAQPPGD